MRFRFSAGAPLNAREQVTASGRAAAIAATARAVADGEPDEGMCGECGCLYEFSECRPGACMCFPEGDEGW